MKNIIFLFLTLFSITISAQNLTGKWTCDDGGTYYLRQIGNELYWYADGGTNWNNVFHGKIRGKTLTGEWVDVPSAKDRNSGSLIVQIISFNELKRTWSSGNFGGTKWTRASTVIQTCNCENDVSGVWDTNYKEMTLKQDGNRVFGTYKHKDGRIEGIMEGNVLSGKWYQNNGSGEIIFTFHDDCTRFTGQYSERGKWYNKDWKGTKK